MKSATGIRRNVLRCLPLLVVLIVAAQTVAAETDPAKLLPGDTFLFVWVRNAKGLRESFKKTRIYGLYKDPVMQRFVAPTEKKIRDFLDETLKKAWKEMGMEDPPKKLPSPQGPVVLGMRLGTKTRKFPVYDWSADRPDDAPPVIQEWRESKVPTPYMVVLMDMGENIDQTKDLMRQMTTASVEQGWKRKTETIRGVEVVTMIPPAPKHEGPPGFQPPEADPTCYAFENTTLILSLGMELMKDVLARRGGTDMETLADDPDFKSTLKTLGAPGDMSLYLNAKALRSFAWSMADVENVENTEDTKRMIRALGLDNVSGLGAVLSLAPNNAEQVHIKALLGVRGEKRGIPALLTPGTMSTKPHRTLTKGLGWFLVGNYDLGKMYDQTTAMLAEAGGPVLEAQMQTFMMMTAAQDPEGRPPVNLRAEVLGQMVGPVTVLNRIDKPYTASDASKILLAIGVRDGNILDAALGRIHDTFVAQGNRELRRELLNCTIYLLPPFPAGMFPFFPTPFQYTAPDTAPSSLAFSVVGDHIVFGKTPMVEQAIRDLRRKDIESILADPMYQHASRYLPGQAGLFFYTNDQVITEQFWVQVKEAAKRAAELPRPGAPTGPDQFKSPTDPMPWETNGVVPLGIGIGPAALGSPVKIIVYILSEYCDFTALPDFESVKKYFGATIGHVVGTDQGIYAEIINLNPPDEK